jgi:hypothetical protein
MQIVIGFGSVQRIIRNVPEVSEERMTTHAKRWATEMLCYAALVYV